MDLGLDSLTDDQVVELLQAVVENITHRDLAAFTVAQQKVWDQAGKAKAAMEALKETFAAERESEIDRLRSDIAVETNRLWAAGELKLLTPDEEADMCAEFGIDAHIRLIDEQLATLQSGVPNIDFCLQLTANEAFVSNGRKLIRIPLPQPDHAQQLSRMIRQMLAPGG